MDPVNVTIWKKFHIRRGGIPPFPAEGISRDILGELFRELGYKTGAEIGVRRGGFSRVLCDAQPDLKLFCVDPWSPYDRVHQARQDGIFYRAQKTLAPFPNVTFVKKTSFDAAPDFADNSLDFVYLDGLHDFDNAMMDILLWSKKVRPGGVVSGHDYFHGYQVGVTHAVDAYTRGHGIYLWYLTTLTTFDNPPSFLWVK